MRWRAAMTKAPRGVPPLARDSRNPFHFTAIKRAGDMGHLCRNRVVFFSCLLLFFLCSIQAASIINDVETLLLRRLQQGDIERRGPDQDTFYAPDELLLLRRLQQDDIERRGPPEDEESSQTTKQSTLMDVWLCLAFSLAWTVWMVAAHIRPTVEKYALEGQVVFGNVLQSTVFVGDGIPMYRSVIDYVLQDEEETQVRKEFTTDVMLEEGFANVEILVLPTDATSGVLKRDWEREYNEFLETHARRKQGRLCSLILGALLVTISLGGAAKTVLLLPVELTTWGWVSIVVGVALLWPVAILLWVNGNVISNLATQSKEEKGVVIRGEQPPLPFQLNPCASVDTSDGGFTSSVAPTPEVQNKHEPQTMKPPAIELSRMATSNVGVNVPPRLRDRIRVISEGESSSTVEEPRIGCYFINLPFRGRSSSQKSRSSMSSVSSGSANNHITHPPSLERNTTIFDGSIV